jgi:hypothetical protein
LHHTVATAITSPRHPRHPRPAPAMPAAAAGLDEVTERGQPSQPSCFSESKSSCRPAAASPLVLAQSAHASQEQLPAVTPSTPLVDLHLQAMGRQPQPRSWRGRGSPFVSVQQCLEEEEEADDSLLDEEFRYCSVCVSLYVSPNYTSMYLSSPPPFIPHTPLSDCPLATRPRAHTSALACARLCARTHAPPRRFRYTRPRTLTLW